MGYQKFFTPRMFAETTERFTRGAAGWQAPYETPIKEATGSGLLLVRRPELLDHLPPPWPYARAHTEVMLMLELPDNQLDRRATERALLRRQVRQVQRIEEHEPDWLGEEQLWLVAPHLPDWLQATKRPATLSPGCYAIDPERFLWIAANELPLRDELIPFLMARSGQALDDFCSWVAFRRPLDWVMRMLTYLPISTRLHEDLTQRLGVSELTSMRASLRRVMMRRNLALGLADEARIDACTDLTTLERWLDQSLTATTAAQALA